MFVCTCVCVHLLRERTPFNGLVIPIDLSFIKLVGQTKIFHGLEVALGPGFADPFRGLEISRILTTTVALQLGSIVTC